MLENLDSPSGARRWVARVATTFAAWLAAFLVVVALLSLFGDQLGSLPLAPRALVMSGVLVAFMVNLVMPALSIVAARWVTAPPHTRPPRGRSGTDPATRAAAEHHPASEDRRARHQPPTPARAHRR
jgi:hypothetical protein